MTKEETESYLKEAKTARLCSLNENGTIHAVPVWYLYEDGQFKMGAPQNSRKAKNIRRNRNVTILIDDSDVEPRQPKGIIIYGRAEIEDWTDPEDPEVFALFKRYMPEEQTVNYAKAMLKLTPWLKIIVKPERIGSFDYKKDERFHNALKSK